MFFLNTSIGMPETFSTLYKAFLTRTRARGGMEFAFSIEAPKKPDIFSDGCHTFHRDCPVGYFRLFRAVEFGERAVKAIGDEDRVVAETVLAARRRRERTPASSLA
jgi:hypothetical protein